MSLAGGILMHSQESRHPAAPDEFTPHCRPRRLGCRNHGIHSFGRHQVAVVVRIGAVHTDQIAELILVFDVSVVGLGESESHVRDLQVENSGPIRHILQGNHLEVFGFSSLPALGARLLRHNHLQTRITQVQRLGHSLGPEAYSGNRFSLQLVQTRIVVKIHCVASPFRWTQLSPLTFSFPGIQFLLQVPASA